MPNLPSLRDVAKMIDHSLLHPTMTDADVRAGCLLARSYDVASACVKPYSVPMAAEVLSGSDVLVCAVIGFPHGNSTSGIKMAETESVALAGAREIDMVVNIGKVKSGDWVYVEREVCGINEVAVANGAVLKVIFENDYLSDAEIIRLCEICSGVGVAFVKTSTGYGFVKRPNGDYNYAGATRSHLELMRRHTSSHIQIKAAGGVRTLDDLLAVRSVGVTRIGATATVAILEEAARRGFAGALPSPASGVPVQASPAGY
jgi:deoxyribose-phosphate aldolase